MALLIQLTSVYFGSLDKADRQQMTHKEESPARVESDSLDRQSIHKTLENCIQPLEPSTQPDLLINIVSGLVASPNVNGDNSIDIGHLQMLEFEASWPEGFYNTISKSVITFDTRKK